MTRRPELFFDELQQCVPADSGMNDRIAQAKLADNTSQRAIRLLAALWAPGFAGRAHLLNRFYADPARR
jgi:hypothetical protein